MPMTVDELRQAGPLRDAMSTARRFLCAAAASLSAVLTSVQAQRSQGAPVFGYDVVNVYPHDREAFTQGLLYRDGVLYESTGLNGRSSLRKVQLETGKVLQQAVR